MGDELVALYADPDELLKHARVVDLAEIEENEFNLNIPWKLTSRFNSLRFPEALQHVITDSPWDAERVWTRLRDQVPVRRGILALDETGLPKQGKHSVGVKRQYCGALGKIGNCQVAVSTVLIGDRLTCRHQAQLTVDLGDLLTLTLEGGA